MAYSFKFSKFLILSLGISTLALSACAGGARQHASAPATAANSMAPELKTTSIDRVMERALADAEANGNSQDVLAMLGQVYARHPEDPIVATRYGRALREDDQINAAVRTLTPFTKDPNKNTEAITEMAMTQLALGDFKAAERYANESIEMNSKNARGYLALGTAQDAQSKHQEAEVSFRKGLQFWQGDPTPILNNLALNLASQGHLGESLSLLEKALKISPNRMDLERNRRIIATLVETSGPTAPPPTDKPKPAPVPSEQAAQVIKQSMENDVPSAEDLNAKRIREKQEQKKQQAKAPVEQKKPSPASTVQKVEKIEPAASNERELTPAELTAPPTTIKNIKLKSSSFYN
ncbi:MAG: tetratricopeptide repeat protein [Alphaproteobacteria bacterium]|nr:tetratricopeptide repeat protein [Alphaproteobacteria bacterium]